jgi:cytochrome oxidase Cu insertion factor (SCO1/SenC/PrrC family)
MIPLILLFTAGYLGLSPQPAAEAAAVEVISVEAPAPAGNAGLRRRLAGSARTFAGAPLRGIAGIAALAVIIVGAAPMAFATVDKTADPITAEAISGPNGELSTPAPNFTLTSQDGRPVSLASLRGKVVLLSFLDPVCTSDCPIIAAELRAADGLLGSRASDAELVAVVANPTYTSTAYTRAFDLQEGLNAVPNWLFLTGTASQLATVWHYFGVEVEDLPGGAMAAHNDIAYVINAKGVVEQEISDDPGPGTDATESSFSSMLADSVLQSMGQNQ